MTKMLLGAGLAAAVLLALPASRAQAQTAYDVNRLNQAVQICNSPIGAGTPECAQLRARMAGGGGVPGLVGGGTASAAAGLLGSLMNASRAPAAPVAPSVDTASIQQGVAACVRNAGGDGAAIQACLTNAQTRPAAPTTPNFGVALPTAAPARSNFGVAMPSAQAQLPSAANGQATAMAIHGAAQSYRSCAAADPSNWQSCLPLLNGGAR